MATRGYQNDLAARSGLNLLADVVQQGNTAETCSPHVAHRAKVAQ